MNLFFRVFTAGLFSLAFSTAPVIAGMEGELLHKPSNEVRVSSVKNDISNRIILQRANARHDEIVVKFKGMDRFSRIAVSSQEGVDNALARFQSRSDVLYAEPNYIATAYMTPNDPYYSYQWHLNNGSYGGIHAGAAWDISTGSGVTVAVVDTGVAYEDYSIYRKAPDLANTTFVSGYDFVNNDSHPNDDNSHGTHVAGTVAQSTNNNVGVAGVAFGASIMPVKVLNGQGSGSYADVADGIRWAADNGAHVITLSLGGPTSATYLEEAVRYAYEKGVTVIAASGNENSAVGYPAAYDNYVIAVGATRYDEQRAPYSNYGASLDIVAPGGDLAVDQNNDGYGDGVLQQTFGNNVQSFGYYFFQGTSMATPHVAGVAALVISRGNATTTSAVRAALETTADDLGVAGRDDMFGWGLLNAAAALSYVSGPVNNPPVANAGADKSVLMGNAVSFDGSGSTDDGTIVSYQWDFSDGSTASGVHVTHSYVAAGTYTVTLTVTDNGGLTGTDTAVVTVTDPNAPITVFADSFEISEWNGLWTEDSQNDWFRSSQRASAGSRSAEVDGFASDAALMSVTINTQGKQTTTISFSWLIESTLDAGEYIALDVSVNGGTWVEQKRLRGDVDKEDVWHQNSFPIIGASSLRLRFRGKMSASNEDANVDNVMVVVR